MRAIILNILIWSFGIAYSQPNCDKYSDNYVPKDLNDALEYLNCKWSEKDKNEFLAKNENDAVGELHMGTGLAIRNSWGLWEKRKNSIVRYFNSLGIYHPDDMSSIILTSFHRKISNKDINLQQQVDVYLKYWEKAKEDSKNAANKKKVLDGKELEKYKIGDKVSMRFAQGNCSNCLLLYNISNNELPWNESQKSCIVKGVVHGKRVVKKYNYILIIELTDICGDKMAYYGDGEKDNLVVGQKFKYNISYFNITKE